MTQIPADAVAVKHFEPLAQQAMEPGAWDYVSGGAADELTLAANAADWSAIKLLPHVLRDVSELDTTVSLFGETLAHPIILAPTALHTNYHSEGELETVRGAVAAEALYVQSSLAGLPLLPIAQEANESGHSWQMQLYIQHDRGWTREFIAQAIALGATALQLTVDTPLLGARDKDKRDTLGTTNGKTFPMLEGAAIIPSDTPAHRRIYNPHISADLTWSDLEWLCAESSVPVVPKGIVRADDAAQAVRCGAAGIIVSNHGARNLDTVISTAQALPAIIDAVAADVPVIVDGGIRRGTDIAKALALGATAVQIGRPYLWGLTAFGAPGVQRIVEILRTELEQAMALLGAKSIADLTREVLLLP